MRNVALAASLLAATLLPACWQCGGFDGDGDRMLRRGDDALMLCENGGYALTLGTDVIEGRYQWDIVGDSSYEAYRASTGTTGFYNFQITQATDRVTFDSGELGGGWSFATLDKYELDHAHVACADLETRDWWKAGVDSLATSHFYTRTTGDLTDQMLLCADGRASMFQYQQTTTDTFTLAAGKVTMQSTYLQGLVRDDGTLDVLDPNGTVQATWVEQPLTDSQLLGHCE